MSHDTTAIKRISPGDLRDLIVAEIRKHDIGEQTAAVELGTAVYKLWGVNEATWPNLSDEDVMAAIGYVAGIFTAIHDDLYDAKYGDES